MRTEEQLALIARYNAHARAYREYWAPVLRPPALRLLEQLRGSDVSAVLEVGSGVGSLSADVRNAFPRAKHVCCDVSRGMLSFAPPEFARVAADATALPVRGSSVDIALMAFMLFHLQEPVAGLLEIARVLRPAGRLGIVTWGHGEIESDAMGVWAECMDEFGAEPRAESNRDAVDSPEKVAALLADAGLKAEDVRSEEMVSNIPANQLIGYKTGLGRDKSRYDALPEETQVACVGEARRRMELLPPEGFIARDSLVVAVASRS